MIPSNPFRSSTNYTCWEANVLPPRVTIRIFFSQTHSLESLEILEEGRENPSHEASLEILGGIRENTTYPQVVHGSKWAKSHKNYYPMMLRILGLWKTPQLVSENTSSLATLPSLPQYHRVFSKSSPKWRPVCNALALYALLNSHLSSSGE